MRNSYSGYIRGVLVRKRPSEASNSDALPKSVQFDEASEDYRCCCDCFHVRTGAMIVGCIELGLLGYFLINSVFLIAQHDQRYFDATQQNNSDVIGPFAGCMAGVGLGLLVIFLMFVGIARKCAILLVPHIAVQVLSIFCFLAMIICAIIALTTNRTIFYRLLNATPFNSHPGQNTVELSTENYVRVYLTLAVYVCALGLECWFTAVIVYCYRYLKERCAYMRYCQAYSTPMKTLSPR